MCDEYDELDFSNDEFTFGIECDQFNQEQIDDVNLEEENYNDIDDDFMDAEELGVMLAIAEDINRSKEVLIDEYTDKENWEKSIVLPHSQKQGIIPNYFNPNERPFEQVVATYCARF